MNLWQCASSTCGALPDLFYLLSLLIYIPYGLVMVDGSPPETTRLVWDVNAGAFGPPRSGAERAMHQFIKGPLPLLWFQKASALPGKALHVALSLWWVKGLCRAATFPFKRKAAATLGISRDATYDALTKLEAAGLIRVDRHRGRSPVVTILEVSS